MKSCRFEGCGRKFYAKGLCHAHYQQVRYGRDLEPIRPRRTNKDCSFVGCSKVHLANGLCAGHRAQRMKGQPLRPLGPSNRKGS